MPTTGIDRCEPSRSAAGASKGVNCRTRALASTPIRKRQRRRRQGRPSTPVVRLRLGTSTKQSSKAGSPEAASRAKATCDSLVPVSPKLTRREATMATKGWRTNNFTLRGGQMWRKHSCLPRRHSCRRSLPRSRGSVELRLDAARRSACATTAAVKLFLRCREATKFLKWLSCPSHRRRRLANRVTPLMPDASSASALVPGGAVQISIVESIRMNENRFSRRYFFYGPLLAGAVPAGGFGSTPSLSALGYKSLNQKLNIAAIGLGTRGPAILQGAAPTENIVALCDVDEVRSARGFGTYPKASKHKDYRTMLDKEGKNIDAVMIATPDHMHTPIALLCMQHGKHVYCEKPLTRTAGEARLLTDAAAKYKVATQMGNQGFNHEGTKTACEILWSGDIGEVREVHAFTGGIYGGQPNLPATGPEPAPVPGTLDWDLWLGPAAPRPFNPLMTNQWRAFLDFSTGGSLGDWLVHNLGPAHLALQLDKASPISVECVAVEGKNQWLWPLRAHTVFEFPARANMPPVTIHAYQNMRGNFQNPPGMGENDRLFPPMNNLADKGRPFVGGGDGMMLVGDQLTGDRKRT